MPGNTGPRFCTSCGKDLSPGVAFCEACGKQVVLAPPIPPPDAPPLVQQPLAAEPAQPAPVPSGHGARSRSTPLGVAIAGIVILALAVGGYYLAQKGGDSSANAHGPELPAAAATAAPSSAGASTVPKGLIKDCPNSWAGGGWNDPGAYPCPDSLSWTKAGPAAEGPVPNSDIWTISLRYHWAGDSAAVPIGMRARFNLVADWREAPNDGCVKQDLPPQPGTFTIESSGTATTQYVVGRGAYDFCPPGTYTAASWTINFDSEVDAPKSWHVTSNTPPFTITLR